METRWAPPTKLQAQGLFLHPQVAFGLSEKKVRSTASEKQGKRVIAGRPAKYLPILLTY